MYHLPEKLGLKGLRGFRYKDLSMCIWEIVNYAGEHGEVVIQGIWVHEILM